MSEVKEFHLKHRPKTFKAVAGNKEAKSMLTGWLKNMAVPHCLLFQGGSGSGKTTLARIMASKLGCGPNDLVEMNAAGKARGIDAIKRIESRLMISPLNGRCRVYIIDECHKMTSDAQNAILKMLEDTPQHVYFMLCTTDPQKLIKTVRTRCSVVKVEVLGSEDMRKLLVKIAKREKLKIEEDVFDAIINVAEGSARMAVVLLNQVAYAAEEDRLDLVQNSDVKRKAFELCRLLMNTRTTWKQVGKFIKEMEDIEPEGFRHMMLAYATTVCLGGGKMSARAFVILDTFRDNYFDSKKAGLVADCYEVINGS